MIIDLPWPPSVNHYWRHTKKGHYISNEGKSYRFSVYFLCLKYKNIIPDDARLSISVEAFPPDRRKRDLDNLFKSLLDSLQNCGIYKDDGQIDKLSIERKTPLIGRVRVTIESITTKEFPHQ